MARQRLVKPDVFQHEELYRAEEVSALPLRLAFVGLWTQCDRRGYFEWKPSRLKLHVLPFDGVDFGAVLSALESAGFVKSYVVDGKRFGMVPSFPVHQSFHVNEKPNPLIPEPPNDTSTVPALALHGASTSVSISVSASSTAPITASAAVAADVANATIQLTTAANRSVAERFGEQVDPLLAANGKTHNLAEIVVNNGIPIDFAVRSIERQVKRAEKPVSTMWYFRKGILDDWAKAKDPAVSAPHRSSAHNDGVVPIRPASSPVAPEDEGVKCLLCRTKELEPSGKRMAPKHKPDCPALAIGNGGKSA